MSGSGHIGRARRDLGLTLIELIAAMAIFALVAVMGLQALTGALRMRDRLDGMAQDAGDLGLGLGLLRNDLSAMMPLLFHPPGGGTRSGLDLSGNGLVLSFSIGGQADLPPVDSLGLHRVEWRLDPGRQVLLRRAWPVLTPADSRAAGPEVIYLTGVRALSVRSYWPQLGWVPGVESGAPRVAPAPGGADSDGPLVAVADSYSDTLPDAVELTLDLEGLGQIRLVEAIR